MMPEAAKITPPGPTRSFLPSLSNSIVPSRIIMNSEWRCLWAGWGIWPGRRVVSCSSTASPVGKTPWITGRVTPFSVFFGVSESKGKAPGVDSTFSLGIACACAWAEAETLPIAANAERATQRSRRFKFFMPDIVLDRVHRWHLRITSLRLRRLLRLHILLVRFPRFGLGGLCRGGRRSRRRGQLFPMCRRGRTLLLPRGLRVARSGELDEGPLGSLPRAALIRVPLPTLLLRVFLGVRSGFRCRWATCSPVIDLLRTPSAVTALPLHLAWGSLVL